jgi:hypothetical protein
MQYIKQGPQFLFFSMNVLAGLVESGMALETSVHIIMMLL